MTIIIDTPEGIAIMRHISLVHALALQVNTGMKLSRGISAIKIAQQDGHTTKRTAKGALRDTVQRLREVYPEYEPSEGVARALLA